MPSTLAHLQCESNALISFCLLDFLHQSSDSISNSNLINNYQEFPMIWNIFLIFQFFWDFSETALGFCWKKQSFQGGPKKFLIF
jgi:hypothetical protein